MTNDRQHLGGTRQSSPLEDEMTYPLTKDEYLTIKENLSIDKISNFESILISTFITAFISGIVIYFSGTFIKIENLNGVIKEILNIQYIITLIVYGAVSLGSMIGYIISYKSKKTTKSTIERLNLKIQNHLEII